MPVCFELTPKGEELPVKLVEVDRKMCEAFNAPVHPDYWFQNWNNVIGLGLACGQTWERLREVNADDPEMVCIINWLEDRYDV